MTTTVPEVSKKRFRKPGPIVYNKKTKMDIEEVKPQIVDVNELVNKWMQSQKDICEVLLSLVNKINEIENKN